MYKTPDDYTPMEYDEFSDLSLHSGTVWYCDLGIDGIAYFRLLTGREVNIATYLFCESGLDALYIYIRRCLISYKPLEKMLCGSVMTLIKVICKLSGVYNDDIVADSIKENPLFPPSDIDFDFDAREKWHTERTTNQVKYINERIREEINLTNTIRGTLEQIVLNSMPGYTVEDIDKLDIQQLIRCCAFISGRTKEPISLTVPGAKKVSMDSLMELTNTNVTDKQINATLERDIAARKEYMERKRRR